MKHTRCYIPHHPRPQLTRKNWLSLNGEWSFSATATNSQTGFVSPLKIQVPFAPGTASSGISLSAFAPTVWYSRTVSLSAAQITEHVLMHFEGSMYTTALYVNGSFVGEHSGAYHRFSFDIRPFLHEGDNVLVVKVDSSLDYELARGKQSWHNDSFQCWYQPITGLWKPVWLEFLGANYIKSAKITPDINDDSVTFDIAVAHPTPDCSCIINISFDGQLVQRTSVLCAQKHNTVKVSLSQQEAVFGCYYWSPECPNLYDVTLTLDQGGIVDEAGSYFGLREFKAEGNKLLLNKVPVYLRLVLDQGYFGESGFTPAGEEALEHDIVLSKQMGFTGARKHQKSEDERYLYYADVLGFFVWCEMPSAYHFSDEMSAAFLSEWHAIVTQHYNHPSVVAWVALNESWGVKTIKSNLCEQSFANAMYYTAKAIDPIRPVISNDGWEHTLSDILTLHHYDQNAATLLARYDSIVKLTEGDPNNNQKQPFADGYAYTGQPIIISEFGGSSYIKDCVDGAWGYGQGCQNERDLVARLQGFINAIKQMPQVCGYCYTQLTDVAQEINGLLDEGRNIKVPHTKIYDIFNS